jgi:hypothetical protein
MANNRNLLGRRLVTIHEDDIMYENGYDISTFNIIVTKRSREPTEGKIMIIYNN